MAEKIPEKIPGIDLGTRNTSMALMVGDKIVQIDFKEGSTILYGPHICPSYVSYDENGNVLEHGGPAKARLPIIPKRTVYTMKRLIGKSYEEGLKQKKELSLSYDINKREDGTVGIIIGTYLFSWDKIPGNENGKLIEFLIQKFGIDWVKTAKIEKIDDGKTIRLTSEKNFLSLILNNEKTKVNLIIDDLKTDEFIVKTENGELNIYNGKVKSVEQVTADFLKRVKREAEAEPKINEPIRKAVITVPAYFNHNQIQATKEAGKLAGFEETDILFEPIASAKFYGHMLKGYTFPATGYLMVIDIGAGTLDIVVIQNQYIQDPTVLDIVPYQIDPETFRTKAIQGNYNLGGVDMDAKIMDYVLRYIKDKYNVDLQADSRIMPTILERVEEAKIQLSTEEDTIIYIAYGKTTYQVPLTRDKLEELVKPLIDECREPIRNALKEAGINRENIDDVIIVGGPANMPIFQKMVVQEVGQPLRKIPLKKEYEEKIRKGELKEKDILNVVEAKDWDPMGCVAKGAAIRIQGEEITNYSHGLVISTGELLDAITDEHIISLIDLIRQQPGVELILEHGYNLKKDEYTKMGLELDKLKEIIGFIKNEHSNFFIELIEKRKVLPAAGNFSIYGKPEETDAVVHVAQLNPQIPTEAISLGKYSFRLVPHLSFIKIDVDYRVKKGRIQTIMMTDKMTGVQMTLEGVEKYPVGVQNGRVHRVLEMNADKAMQKVEEVKKRVEEIGLILSGGIGRPPPELLIEYAREKANKEIRLAENKLKEEMPPKDRKSIEVALEELEDALKETSKVLKVAKDDEMLRHGGILVKNTENLHKALIRAKIPVSEKLLNVAMADAAKCRSDAKDFIKKGPNPDIIKNIEQRIKELEKILNDKTMDRNIKYQEIYAKIREIEFNMSI